MLNNLLKEIVSNVAGKQTEGIVDIIYTEKHVNEFLIAKKLDLTINQTRNILYKLSDNSLVSSIRKKDKKKGWFTYFWKIDLLKSLDFLKRNLLEHANQIKDKLKIVETKMFYECPRCRIELLEEEALLQDFECNECGDIFSVKDNSKLLRELRKNLGKTGEKLLIVDKEIGKEQEKLDKKRSKEIKKFAKEKTAKRKEAAKKRSEARKNKMAVKKKVVKKAPKKSQKKPAKKKKIKKSSKKPSKKKPAKKKKK